MSQRASQQATVASLARLPLGTYVQLEGRIRSLDPVSGPVTGARLLGFHVICSLFSSEHRDRPAGFRGKREVLCWSDAVLRDAGGREVRLLLSRSRVRAPALQETSFEDEANVVLFLEELGIRGVRPTRLEVIERGVIDGSRVTVVGLLGRYGGQGSGAFRTSARPGLAIEGTRQAPIVIVPW